MAKPALSLVAATAQDRDLLSRMLRAYQSELLPYGDHPREEAEEYKYLPNYFTDPDRWAFFIHVGGNVAGFILVNQHTLVEKDAHAIAEFYIAPEFRRQGVGEQAARLAFNRFPGKWEVAQMGTNLPAIAFWRKAIGDFTSGRYKETLLETDDWRGPVQTFSLLSELRLKILIERPPREVFAFTLDPANTPKWIGGIAEEQTNEWPPRLGTIYRNHSGDEKRSNLEITEFKPHERFTMSSRQDAYHVTYTFESVGDSATELEYFEWMDEGELREPFSIEILQKLKAVVESRA